METLMLLSEVEHYSGIVKQRINEYFYWKLCYDHCIGKTSLKAEANQELINSVLRQLAAPVKLTTFEILALILYQVETNTLGENVTMLLYMVASLVNDNKSVSHLKNAEYRELKHYSLQLILNNPPYLITCVKKSEADTLKQLNKISDITLNSKDVNPMLTTIRSRQHLTVFPNVPRPIDTPNESQISQRANASDRKEVTFNSLENTCQRAETQVEDVQRSTSSDVQKENQLKSNVVSSHDSSSEISFSTATTNFKKPQVPKPLVNNSSKTNIAKENKTGVSRQLYTACKELVEFTPVSETRRKRVIETPKVVVKKKRYLLSNTSLSSEDDPYNLDNYQTRSSMSVATSNSRLSPRRRGYCPIEKKKRVPWSLEEEEALVLGVVKHGKGNWKMVKLDRKLNERSVRDCYDKWKNINKYNHLENIKARVHRKAKS